MDITITLTDNELLRIAAAIKGNRGLEATKLTDPELVTAILEEHLKNWARSYERNVAAKAAGELAEQKVTDEILPGKGEVVLAVEVAEVAIP